VNAGDNRYDRITLGNGDHDAVNADRSFDDDILTLGNGAGDAVSADLSSYAKIALGNGINDFVSADHSSFDTIILGNGAGDTVTAFGTAFENYGPGSYHLSFPGFGHVLREGSAYRWLPADWRWM
jgi:hypothetical protein